MASPLRIGDREIGAGAHTFVIAEAGVNHDGSVARAHDLVDRAADAAADAVKFQTFRSDALVAADAPRAAYQQGRLGSGASQHSMLASLELPLGAWRELQSHARERGILFVSTPFDERSLDLLVEMDVPAIKIGSGDATDLRLLRRAAATKRPVLCSTGMTTFGEIAVAIETIREAGGDLAILHCVSSYPAPADQTNLAVIPRLAGLFDVNVGYSDHTLGRLASIVAVALGACIIEKHLTTDRSLPGPDHRASLDPDEFATLVREIRDAEDMLGTGVKRLQPAEVEIQRVARRSLVYASDLDSGTLLAADHLAMKRPADGLPPSAEPIVVGRTLRRTVRRDQRVDIADLE